MYLTKLTDREKKKIIAEYVDCQNFRQVARKHNRSVNTIIRVVRADENLEQKVTEKKEENTKDILQYMESKKKDTQRVLDKLLRGIEVKADEIDEDTDLKSLATAYGIVLDKQLKIVEMLRGVANNEQLTKVQELLSKLDEEAKK